MQQNINFFEMDRAGLGELLKEYPWFVSARVRRMQLSADTDDMLGLTLLTKPWPASLLHGESLPAVENEKAAPEKEPAPSDDIIDKFLASGEKKIVPDESTPLDDVSENSSVFVPDEDMDTGELARIYRQQGLDRMADEVSEIVDESLDEI